MNRAKLVGRKNVRESPADATRTTDTTRPRLCPQLHRRQNFVLRCDSYKGQGWANPHWHLVIRDLDVEIGRQVHLQDKYQESFWMCALNPKLYTPAKLANAAG